VLPSVTNYFDRHGYKNDFVFYANNAVLYCSVNYLLKNIDRFRSILPSEYRIPFIRDTASRLLVMAKMSFIASDKMYEYPFKISVKKRIRDISKGYKDYPEIKRHYKFKPGDGNVDLINAENGDFFGINIGDGTEILFGDPFNLIFFYANDGFKQINT
jgi:hypothetical protein